MLNYHKLPEALKQIHNHQVGQAWPRCQDVGAQFGAQGGQVHEQRHVEPDDQHGHDTWMIRICLYTYSA